MPKITDKHEKFALLVVMTFVILAVVITAMVSVQKSAIEKRLSKIDFQRQEGGQVDLAEENAAKMGWNKMIAGDLTLIDGTNNLVQISVDPLGENKKYEINMSSNTEFLKSELEFAPSSDCEDEDCDELDIVGESFESSSFAQLQEGQLVEVYFPNRVDMDGGEDLVAEKIVILQN